MSKKATTAIAGPLTKAQLTAAIAEETGLSKKEVGGVLDALSDKIRRQLKPKGPGSFTLPGIAKFTIQKKAARKARKGLNPFTGEEIMFKAKPASRAVKIRPLKALKDAV